MERRRLLAWSAGDSPALPGFFCLLVTLCLVSALCLGNAAGAIGAATNTRIAGVRVGLDGKYKVGTWTRVEVALEGAPPGSVLHLATDDSDGNRVWQSAAVDAPLYVRFGHLQSTLEVELRDGDNEVIARRTFRSLTQGEGAGNEYPPALSTDDEILLNLGPAIGLSALPPRWILPQRQAVTQVVEGTSLTWPATMEWRDFASVDELVLGGEFLSSAECARLAPAIAAWVRRGGRALIWANGEELAPIGLESPVRSLLPGVFEDSVRLRLLRPLETYADASVRLAVSGDQPPLEIPRLRDVRGVVEAAEGDLPLVIRTPHAFGEVAFMPLSLVAEPLASWGPRAALVNRLLGRPRSEGSAEGGATERGGQVTWLGFTDLAGQLFGALDRYEQVRLIPFWMVASLALAYVALIGPVDYFLLRFVFRRMEWTWATFPVFVVTLSLGAFLLAGATKGDRLRMRQVDLVDVDVASGFSRCITWCNLFSPRTAAYDLKLAASFGAAQDQGTTERLLSWRGLPGTALGGMEVATSGRSAGRGSYTIEGDRMEQVPVAQWSSKGVVGEWTTDQPAALEAALTADAEEVLGGELTNRLDVPLTDGLLAFGRWAITFKQPIGAGETFDLSSPLAEIERTELATRLTQKTMVFDSKKNEFNQVTTPYQRESYEVGLILRQILFHRAAGGAGYAELSNRYLHRLDLSSQLTAGRAVLLARADLAGSRLLVDGKEPPSGDRQQETFVRFVIPVTARTGRR
jgi:hypothetical protein